MLVFEEKKSSHLHGARRMFLVILMAPKKRKIASKGATPSLSLQNPRKFITIAVEGNYNALSVWPFILERGFPRHNPNFNFFLYNRRH